MCGIVGYIGEKQAVPILMKGLAKLEYRGYDSAGIAVISDREIAIHKTTGKLENLARKIKGMTIPGTIGIGHTRWATHGGVTDLNAHPHASCKRDLVVIHNGIIENYQELKEDLLAKGHVFQSETDTEVIAHLIEQEFDTLPTLSTGNPLTEAVRRALSQVEGGYAIVVLHRNRPDTIVAARMHNPLIIGLGKGENLVASDIPALLDYTKVVCDLENGQMAEISKNSVRISNLQGKEQPLVTRTITWDVAQAEKGGYPHFLIKEIHETPAVLRDVLRNKIRRGSINPQPLGLEGLDLRKINKITLLGCGSAAYACLYGKYLLEKWTRITTEVQVGSEFRYHQPIIDGSTLVIALSQSGETADTLASIELAKKAKPMRTIGVINAIGSSMTRQVDQVCLLQAGPEISVASTKAFSSMIVSLALMALHIGKVRGVQTDDSFLSEINRLPELTSKVLEQEHEIARIATYYIHHQDAYYIGRDVNYPSALEGSQKLKELSYIHAEAYPAGELKHGPNAVIYDHFPIICLVPEGHVYKKMISNIQEMKARKASILSFATEGDTRIAAHSDHVVFLPRTSEEISVMVNTLAMQLFAYYVTLYKGYSIDQPRSLQKYFPKPGEITAPPKSIDIDKPRNLAKSVTVE
ncbi:hypothetical protein AUK40_01110 [Candidatus Wirthbacteria bacterium CG2_30_54_11]|uniref:Glutamine--fructose-6-phosphate aminotransferase [isomerizing] n=1 Tax=Candidatus Wirthbacteria bacterium CG2_30_54_11 TaxID=1817892 RepID=A0A1J5IQ07_9BACT|nr:MAG: hypothetical protein AUK40_01110 [Candidatus Wirthbacteria bacterium CG2_30_54_11]